MKVEQAPPVLTLMPPQEDLPPGPTWQCSDCGERVRTGQPHSTDLPWPHQSLRALIVEVPATEMAERTA